MEEDNFGNTHLTRVTEDEIFDLLWTLDLVCKTDICFQVMEICLLWQKFWLQDHLGIVLFGKMLDLFNKQNMPREVDSDLSNDLEKLSIAPSHRPQSRIRRINKGTEITALNSAMENDFLSNWHDEAARQDQNVLSQIVKISQLLHKTLPEAGDDERAWVDLAHDSYFRGETALALISASTVYLGGEQGCISAEEQPQHPLVNRHDAKSIVQEVLRSVLRLHHSVGSLLTEMKKVEDAFEAFAISVPRCNGHTRRPSDLLEDAYHSADDTKSVLIGLRLHLAGVQTFSEAHRVSVSEVQYGPCHKVVLLTY